MSEILWVCTFNTLEVYNSTLSIPACTKLLTLLRDQSLFIFLSCAPMLKCEDQSRSPQTHWSIAKPPLERLLPRSSNYFPIWSCGIIDLGEYNVKQLSDCFQQVLQGQGFCYGVISKSGQILTNLVNRIFFKKLPYRSNNDDSPMMRPSGELQNHILPLVVARMLVFTGIMILRFLDFKVSLEFRRGQWRWDKLKCQSSLFFLRFSCFS